ncbi:MAG: hypothetical protein B7Z55_01530 [Planctomycetales bacterium 12-60-4]|nr:MAG: hypothetical protein B7Z55_01530 [Planctomycetales bacterium 12-60-4]
MAPLDHATATSPAVYRKLLLERKFQTAATRDSERLSRAGSLGKCSPDVKSHAPPTTEFESNLV